MAAIGGCEIFKSDAPNRIELPKIRDLIKSYTDRHQLETALFWANKLVSLSKGELQDVYIYSNLLYLTGQYHRAIHQLKIHRLDRLLIGRYLHARCLFAAKDYQEALNVIDQIENGRPTGKAGASSKNLEKQFQGISTHNIESAVHLLRGHILEALENRSMAVDCYREALMSDVQCYEALDCLIQHHMLTAVEEQQLVSSLPVAQQCGSPEEAEFVQFCYNSLLKKYNSTAVSSSSNLAAVMCDNSDVCVSTAEQFYLRCDFQLCYNLTSKLLTDDPYNPRCLPLHVAVLVELKKLNGAGIHIVCNVLTEANEQRGNKAFFTVSKVSWFAVGCYYLTSGKQEPARRYLSKSTSLNRVFGPAWLAYGHSFAAENEHDQAMAAYFTASQLMKGCHLPLLYVGLEYGLTNNSKLADRFFKQALAMAPDSPFILHEIGVIAFQSQEYEKAEQYFLLTLEKLKSSGIQQISAEKWEPLLNNLGHVSRKLKKYDDALEFHRQSLVICPQNSSTLSAMGYVYALSGNYAEAVNCFHKALGLKKDDTFSTTMLNNTIELLVNDIEPVEEMAGALPKYQYFGRLGDMSAERSTVSLTTVQPISDLERSDDLATMSSTGNCDSSLQDSDMMMDDV